MSQHTSDSIAEAIRPTLDTFAGKVEPLCRQAADDIYERLLCNVQDYLRENAEWNIGAEVDRCRKTEADNRSLRDANAALLKVLVDLDCSEILGVAESCASGMPRWEFVNKRIEAARAAIGKAGAA